MIYPYVTLNDETEITFSKVKTAEDGHEYIDICYEKPVFDGFISAVCQYPDDNWTIDGLSQPQIDWIKDFVKHNGDFMLFLATDGGPVYDE